MNFILISNITRKKMSLLIPHSTATHFDQFLNSNVINTPIFLEMNKMSLLRVKKNRKKKFIQKNQLILEK